MPNSEVKRGSADGGVAFATRENTARHPPNSDVRTTTDVALRVDDKFLPLGNGQTILSKKPPCDKAER